VVLCGGMEGRGFRAGGVVAAAVLVDVVVDLDDWDGVAGGGEAHVHLAMLAVGEIDAGGLV
jgi:hypothetical protein